jgi:hypothetical protein
MGAPFPSCGRYQPPAGIGPVIFKVGGPGASDSNNGITSPTATLTRAYSLAYQLTDFGLNANVPRIQIWCDLDESFNVSNTMVGSVGVIIQPMVPITWSSPVAGLSIADGGIAILGAPPGDPAWPSPPITWKCNQGPNPSPGDIILHNYAVLDDFTSKSTAVGAATITDGIASSIAHIYCDNVDAIFTVESGRVIEGNYDCLIHMDQGGRGTFSGGAAPLVGSAPFVNKLFYLDGPARCILDGSTFAGGYASLGPSIVQGGAGLITNGANIAGPAPTFPDGRGWMR